MPSVRKDNYSRLRISSVIRMSIMLGRYLMLLVYLVIMVMGIYATVSNIIPQVLSILMIIFGFIWSSEMIINIFTENSKPYDTNKNKEMKWDNENRWLIIFLLSLNISFIFFGYAAIQRRIYNALI